MTNIEELERIVKTNKLENFFSVPNIDGIATAANLKLTEWLERTGDVPPQTRDEYARSMLALALYRIDILLDDSSSMFEGNRIATVERIVSDIIELNNVISTDGIRIHYLNEADPTEPIKSANEFSRAWHNIKFHGPTKLGTVLTKIWSEITKNQAQFTKPCLIYIITDGEPTGEPKDELARSITECKRALDRFGYEPTAITFGIVRVGNDPRAREFLDDLTKHKALNNHLDIVNEDGKLENFTESEGRSPGLNTPILKLLTGAITKTMAARLNDSTQYVHFFNEKNIGLEHKPWQPRVSFPISSTSEEAGKFEEAAPEIIKHLDQEKFTWECVNCVGRSTYGTSEPIISTIVITGPEASTSLKEGVQDLCDLPIEFLIGRVASSSYFGFRGKNDPIVPGSSCSSVGSGITGTIGGFIKMSKDPNPNDIYAVSNHHVFRPGNDDPVKWGIPAQDQQLGIEHPSKGDSVDLVKRLRAELRESGNFRLELGDTEAVITDIADLKKNLKSANHIQALGNPVATVSASSGISCQADPIYPHRHVSEDWAIAKLSPHIDVDNLFDANILRPNYAGKGCQRFLQVKGWGNNDNVDRLRVFKRGRTTGYTVGYVNGIKAYIEARRNTLERTWEYNVITTLPTGIFSMPGDSGSWIMDKQGLFVGMIWGVELTGHASLFTPAEYLFGFIRQRTGFDPNLFVPS